MGQRVFVQVAGPTDAVWAARVAKVKRMAPVRRRKTLFAALLNAFHVLVHKVDRLENFALNWTKVAKLLGFWREKIKIG